MAPKTAWAVAAAAAIAASLALSVLHGRVEPKSQIDQIRVGRN